MASSRKSLDLVSEYEGTASRGDDVIVKPPAFAMPGTCTSSHCPGRNLSSD
jgi:hypothetical protein